MTATPENPGALNWLLVVLTSAIWGTAFMSMKVALEGFGPVTVAALRVSLGIPVLLIGGQMLGQGIGRLGSRRIWVFAALVGVLNFSGPFFLLSWGQQFVPSALAGVAMGTVPLFLIPLAIFFLKDEKVTLAKAAGLIFGFSGLVLLVGGDQLASVSTPGATLGALACVSTALSYAIGSIVTRRSPPVPPVAFTAAALIVASAIMIPAALVFEGWPQDVSVRPFAAVLYAAVFPTAIASFMRVTIIKSAGSLFMSLASYMVPVWAVFFGIVLMGEDLPPTLLVAVALILGGIGLSQWKAFAAIARSAFSRPKA